LVIATIGDNLWRWQLCNRGHPFGGIGSIRPRTKHGGFLRARMLKPALYDKCLSGAISKPGKDAIVSHLIPNDDKRYRNAEPIETGFVESTVNEVVSKRFCKKQHMQWSKEGAHLLLQTRVRTLNGELAGIFKRWYPDLDIKVEEIPIAA